MPARLTLHPAHEPPRRWLLFEEKPYELGRDDGCDLAVDDDRVSRRHARLEFRGGAWRIADLGSKNGLSVDGLAADAAPLAHGSWLSVGGVLGLFEELAPEVARRELEGQSRRWLTSAEHQRRLDPGLALDELLQRVLGSVLELSGAERGFVLLAGEQGLEVVAARGLVSEELRRAEFAGSVGAVERALAERRPVASADLGERTSLAARPSVIVGGIRALVCIPMVALGKTLGALYADSKRPGVCFDALDVELLEAFAGHAALAVALARLQGELQWIARELPRLASDGATEALAAALASAGGGVAASPGGEAPLPSWSEVVGSHAPEPPG